MNKEFNTLINKFHAIEWLYKSIERNRNRDMSDLTKKENLSAKTEFLVILIDIALRVSQKEKNLNQLPTNQDFVNFIHLYVNTQQNNHSLIKKNGIMALSLMLHEQVKDLYPEMNLIGRMLILYREYEDDIEKMTGLKIDNILAILLALKGQYAHKDFYIFSLEDISYDEVGILESEKVKKFLDYFSISIKDYKLKLKALGFDKRMLYSFRLIERYPIIKIDNKYIVPSIDNLSSSLTTNLNIHLLEYYASIGKGGKYHNSLGSHFENYIEKLSKYTFEDITPSIEIVPKDTLNSEFVIVYKDTSITVEVKKFNFRRDSAFKNSIEDLEELSKRHLVKAFAQIETTLKYTKTKSQFGIIVIFGDLNMHAMIKDYLKKNYPKYIKENGEEIDVAYLDNIIIMSVGTYESLLSNNPDDILEILNTYLEKDINDRGDILQTISAMKKEATHQLLRNTYQETFDSYELEKYKKALIE